MISKQPEQGISNSIEPIVTFGCYCARLRFTRGRLIEEVEVRVSDSRGHTCVMIPRPPSRHYEFT
jgi:hypothetical protein